VLASFQLAEKNYKAAGMEEHAASSGGARESREVAAAISQVAEAKEDVKEVERKVSAAEAKVAEAKEDVKEVERKVAEAEAKVAAARQAVNQAVNQKDRAEANFALEYATFELQYAQQARAVALDALKSSQEGQTVRERILNELLLRQSGGMPSRVLCVSIVVIEFYHF
jgi:chromosome segregation ATPase